MNCSFESDKLLVELRHQCVSIWPDTDNDTLHVWPASRLTPAQVAFIRANKPEIIHLLRQRNTDLLPPDEVCRAWRRRYCNTERRI